MKHRNFLHIVPKIVKEIIHICKFQAQYNYYRLISSEHAVVKANKIIQI